MPRALPLPDPPLADDAVLLRPWRDQDVQELVVALRDPEIPRWTFIPVPYREREARDFLVKQRRDREGGIGLALAIASVDDPSMLLGGVGIEPVDRAVGRGEMGYWVAAEHRGHGVATRAVRLLSAWALETLGLKRLELLTFTGNRASERVAERAGYTRERDLPAHRFHPLSGEVRDMALYVLRR